IFITGENGTGKELVARSIHLLSPRVNHPLIDVNCAAIPDKFIESELFGHEKGALAAATPKKIGKFELATNGTLFFDEISDMSLRTQAMLLRVLQEQQFQRIGGGRVLNVNVRVIAASNKDIETEIEKGRFRKELYYRLNVIPIEVPSLRHRPDDIPLLVEIFFDELSKENQRKKKRMNHNALELLFNYSWPGNVRELKNLTERLAIMIQSDAIDASDIPHPYNPNAGAGEQPSESNLFFIDRLEDAKKAFEMAFIKKKLSKNKNNLAKTAEAIDIKQSYLYEILNR
ncbi:MAG TPA: sigma-54 dependent transcriptional regulator, partial [Desulfobacterales bacterium]|nr:sigma-54 dependent transcriptional regulator [Desulfobacterales bacterium]